MEIDFKIITAVVIGVFGLVQWLSKRNIDKSKSNRESLTQLSELLSEDINIMSEEKKLLVEEAMSAHYKKNIYINEILLLLKAVSPKSAIENYLKYRRYLKVEGNIITYKKNPFTSIPLIERKLPTMLIMSVIGYFIFAFIGGSIIQYSASEIISFNYSQLSNEMISNLVSNITFLMVGISFGFVAVILLLDGLLIPSKAVLENGLKGVFESI